MTSLSTYDFSTLYTALPHNLIKDKFIDLIESDALIFLLDNVFICFGNKLYRRVVGISMGTYCAPLVADLFLFCMRGAL